MKTILFTHFGENWIRGSERMLLDIMAGLDRTRFRPVLWCNADAMAVAARAAGVEVIQSAMAYFLDYSSPRPNPLTFLRLVWEARRIIRLHRVELVHANSAAPCQWLAPAARLCRVPVVAHVHAGYLPRSRFVTLLHQAAVVVGASKHTLDGLARDGVPRDRLRVVLNGVDLQRLAGGDGRGFREELGIRPEAFVILSVGALVHIKGHDRLIGALHWLLETNPDLDAHLVIIGEGECRAELQAQADQLGLAGRVHLVGPRPALASVFKDASCFALASRQEAFGLVLAEAGACGLATVATAIGGIPEVVVNNRTGLLVDKGDEDSTIWWLAACFKGLADFPSARVLLGENAAKHVATTFRMARVVQQLEAIYGEVLQVPPAERRLAVLPYGRQLVRRPIMAARGLR